MRLSALIGVLLLGFASPGIAQPAQQTRGQTLRVCCGLSDAALHTAIDTTSLVLRVQRNPAVLPVYTETWRRTTLSLSGERGATHRAQEARALDAGTLSAEGGQSVGGATFTGGVAYTRGRELDVRWRNGSDAYAGNSYIWADSVGGDYQRDALGLNAAMRTRDWHGWRAGVMVDYGLGQGARQNDPRPQYRMRIAELTPGLSWQHAQHTLAGAITRAWTREDLEIGGGNSAEYPVVFRLRGIGTFDRTQLISAERAVVGSAWLTSVAYGFAGVAWQSAVSVSGQTGTTRVRDGVATPVSGGDSRTQRWRAQWLTQRRQGDGAAELLVQAERETLRGTDPVFAAVNAIDEGARSEARVRVWRGTRVDNARWSLALQGRLETLQRRDIASETSWRVAIVTPAVEGLARHRVGSAQLMSSVGIARRMARDPIFESGRPTRITAELARDDADIVSRSMWVPTAAVAWEFRETGPEAALRARLRLGITVLQHSTQILSTRTATGRSRLSLSWELL